MNAARRGAACAVVAWRRRGRVRQRIGPPWQRDRVIGRGFGGAGVIVAGVIVAGVIVAGVVRTGR